MSNFTTRPVVMGTRGVVTSGHYLASVAGFRIMEQGGNAIDAAAAICFALNLLEPQNNSTGGEAPTLIYSAKEKKTYAVSGQGWSPAAFTTGWCRANGVDMIPGDGYLPACVPAVVGTWAVALAHFGTMSFAQILQPTIELAANGFPIYEGLHNYLVANRQKFFERYPTTAALYYPNGKTPVIGQVWRNPDYAGLLNELVAAETAVKAKGRITGLEAARDAFYKGEIAHRIIDFIHQNPMIDSTGVARPGLLSYDDIAEWYGGIEEPVTVNYRGLDVHKCPSWTQGPVFLQQLTLLEGFDLAAMGHNSADYLHTVIECAKLAFADREAYYGDPRFDQVPMAKLLSKPYADERRSLVGATASHMLRPGDVGDGTPSYATFDVLADNRQGLQMAHLNGMPAHARGSGMDLPDDLRVRGHLGDTTHLDAIDRAGNMAASTPSGGWIGTSPVIPGCGFPLGTRGQMFYLNAHRPNALEPHKRPRATLTPTLVTRECEPWMAFGTPGGDSQDQWTLQLFLNIVDFGMNIQEALDAPTVDSVHFPSSFYPREAFPARMGAENRIAPAVIAELRRREHEVGLVDGWVNGKCMGIRYHRELGVIMGGAAAKGNVGYAIGW